MGYFANGFVFTSKPDFRAVSKAVPGRIAQGYKHKRLPVWLLDLWKPRDELHFHQAPFCDPAADGFRTDLTAVDAATCEFLTAIEGIKRAAGYRTASPEDGYIHLALAIAAAARAPTFFFAADDDETDMAGRTVPGSLVSFGCRLDRLSVQYSSGRTVVTPLKHVQDGDTDGFRRRVGQVERVRGITVSPPREVEGGQNLYENPVAQWPWEAGDPAAILGLGTWDPLVNVESDFTIVC
jgi:hypothetical protein